MLSKSSMIAEIAERTGNSKLACERIINALSDLMGEELKAGREVTLHGIGKFYPVQRAARKGRSPFDQSVIEIPAKAGVRYKLAKPLDERLNAEQ